MIIVGPSIHTTERPRSLILDGLPGAALILSLRKMRTAYTGAAIKVRRSSDNATQDINFVNNVLDTSSLLSFLGGSDGFIDTWYDQSGNGHHAVQTTATNQPRIATGGVIDSKNSRSSILFDGTDNYLIFSGTGLDMFRNISGASVSAVWQSDNNSMNQRLLTFSTGTATTARFVLNKTGSNIITIQGRRLNADASAAMVNGTSTPTALISTTALMNYAASDAFQYENNVLVASNTSFQTDGTTQDTASNMGRIGASGSGTEWLDGYASEIVIYKSLTTVTTLVADQLRYYSIT